MAQTGRGVPPQAAVDGFLEGLRRHSRDAYKLVPGQNGARDRWAARCPLHPSSGFHLVVVDEGDDREPSLWCKVGCPPRVIRYTLNFDAERDRVAAERAEVLVWAQNWRAA
jgi:hypothetical protein